MEKEIAVIIPAFNEEHRLPGCLTSLKKQDFEGKVTVIVVDNNSTDQTAKIARQWGAKVVNEKQQGIGPAKARGVKEVKEEIVAFLDADNKCPPHWLSRIWKNLQDPQKLATAGPYSYQTSSALIKETEKWVHLVGCWVFGAVPGGNMAFKREALQKRIGFEGWPRFGEDIFLSSNFHRREIVFDPLLTVEESGRRPLWSRGNLSYLLHSFKFLITKSAQELEKILMEKRD